MAGVNKVILVGRLGGDPEMRYTNTGMAVGKLNIATSENWTDKNSQKQERTEWHRIVVWGKLAEICNQYLKKGRQIYVEGRLQTRSWDDKNGTKRYTTEVVASTVQFLGSGTGAGAGERNTDAPSGKSDFSEEPSFMETPTSEESGPESDGDVPF